MSFPIATVIDGDQRITLHHAADPERPEGAPGYEFVGLDELRQGDRVIVRHPTIGGECALGTVAKRYGIGKPVEVTGFTLAEFGPVRFSGVDARVIGR